MHTVFYSGSEISTKFYRIYDTKTDFPEYGYNGLRAHSYHA